MPAVSAGAVPVASTAVMPAESVIAETVADPTGVEVVPAESVGDPAEASEGSAGASVAPAVPGAVVRAASVAVTPAVAAGAVPAASAADPPTVPAAVVLTASVGVLVIVPAAASARVWATDPAAVVVGSLVVEPGVGMLVVTHSAGSSATAVVTVEPVARQHAVHTAQQCLSPVKI